MERDCDVVSVGDREREQKSERARGEPEGEPRGRLVCVFPAEPVKKKRVWSAVNDRVRVASAEGIVVFAWVDLRARRDEDAGRPEREPR